MKTTEEKTVRKDNQNDCRRYIGSIQQAISDLKSGKMIILVDDADRENEGDLVYPAEKASPEIINFYETHARGWICVPMASAETERLELPLMVERNTERHGTAFTVTVDAAHGTTTGISAGDQAHTIRVLADPESKPSDLLRPGHVRPIRARAGGVLERTGHTEAVVDLMKLAGYRPAGMICEIKNEDGSMARLPQLIEYGKKHGINIYAIEDLIKYRLLSERLVKRAGEAQVKTLWGEFTAIGYESVVRDEEHLALVHGNVKNLAGSGEPILVRVHNAQVLCDIFGVRGAGQYDRIDAGMKKIVENGAGVFIYIRSRLRGQRMLAQLIEMAETKEKIPNGDHREIPPEHVKRDYGLGAQIIMDLGITRIRVLTNHPRDLIGMAGYEIEIVENVPLNPLH